METIQNLLIILAVAIVGFWYFGGFKILGWFKARGLRKQVIDPVNTPEIKSLHHQYASTQTIRSHEASFSTYAILQKITHQDVWPKVAHEHDPQNPLAVCFYSASLLKQGWAIRGTGSANSLSIETVEAFRKKLIQAETLLLPQIEKSANPADLIFLILDVYLALGQRFDAEKLLEEYRPFLKDRLDIALKDLKMLYPRWGGSHEKLQARANIYSQESDLLVGAKAFAYCHLIEEDEDGKAYKALVKTGVIEQFIQQYKRLPKTPRTITSYEDYNLLLAHKICARFFFYSDNKPLLKQAITNTSGLFAEDEIINPNTKTEIRFIDLAIELRVSSFV
jgi:hypothetical protein